MALTGESHLITNAHVVGDADAGQATFADGSVADLEIVGPANFGTVDAVPPCEVPEPTRW